MSAILEVYSQITITNSHVSLFIFRIARVEGVLAEKAQNVMSTMILSGLIDEAGQTEIAVHLQLRGWPGNDSPNCRKGLLRHS
jgi:hypothetical protein